MIPPVLLPLAAAALAIPVIWIAGAFRARLAGPAACAGAAATLLALAFAGWFTTAGTLRVPWIPSWGIELVFRIDGLALTYGVLTAAVAVIVLVYAVPYMPHHLRERAIGRQRLTSFFLLFGLFITAMIGLVASLDLIQLFVFWDVTAICSYLLIAYDRDSPDARRAALTALLVTGMSSVLLLVAAVLFHAGYGTTDLSRLAAAARHDALTTAACALLIVAALAKSAQWPLHFWLPRAMVALTPVSAYLHAAAMVAAGVFLLQRVQPIIDAQPSLPAVLRLVGWVSVAGGGVLALREDELKRVLAYSTIAQYGHVTFLLGLGGSHAPAAAAFFVVAHGLCKSALFLSAGAITYATGEHRLSGVGGLLRAHPVLGAATAIAAAGLAGVPLTVGYFKDELLFERALEHGLATTALALTGPALTIAYTWRFWSRVFLGRRRGGHARLPPLIVAPIVAAAAAVVVLGVAPAPLATLAGRATMSAPAALHPAYHFDLRPTNVAALAAFATALLLVIAPLRALRRPVDALAHSLSPERVYDASARVLWGAGAALRRHGPLQLRGRLAAVFITTVALVLAGQIAVGLRPAGAALSWPDAPLAAALLGTSIAALVTVRQRRQLTAALALSMTSIGLAAVFALAGAPDVALVLVIINVVTVLLMVALLVRLPNEMLTEQQHASPLWRWRGEDELLAAVGACLAFLVTWGVLVQPAPERWIGEAHLALAKTAHAENVVAAIVVDFRALDTMGEISVVVISVLALQALMRERRGTE